MFTKRQAPANLNTVQEEMEAIIDKGLDLNNRPYSVIVVGAGVAGLVAASLLKRAGHRVTILEGNNRVGGRVYTIREPFTIGNYLEAGAMRFPDTHKLTLAYINKFKLPFHRFNNTNENDYLFVNGKVLPTALYEENPDLLGFPLPEEEQGKTAEELFTESVQPFIDLYNSQDEEGKKLLIEKFNKYSFEDFLRNNPIGRSLSPNAIRMIKVLLGIEGFPEYSFTDILLDIVSTVFNEDLRFLQITGGNDLLPKAFLNEVGSNIILNQKVEEIIQYPDHVSVIARDVKSGSHNIYNGDFLITTVPYSAFQFIDVHPYSSFSFDKWKAIRELNYVTSVKIGLEFKRKFWETQNIGNITSDFPIRFTYNPSDSYYDQGPAVMLASYSWGQNAMLWSSLSDEVKISEALRGLAKIYGHVVYEEYLNGAVYDWGRNPYSAGCFTLFTPYQEQDFGDALFTPEGRVHFAGEHTSNYHGWVEGAIESGIRAAIEVNGR
ncbi:flavin monoamine oxidase family protein [Halobacillus sp. B23F22_1]|uniref:flavin monoamine oxidase family protein n=1 Tax=Halobacillus sp. B23F22_1 TaxID=3459514 RepID=UPI00373E1F06